MSAEGSKQTGQGQSQTSAEDVDDPVLAEKLSFKPVLWWIVVAGYCVAAFGIFIDLRFPTFLFNFPFYSLLSILGAACVAGLWKTFCDELYEEAVVYGLLAALYLAPSSLAFIVWVQLI